MSALPVTIHAIQGLNHNLVLIKILLELVSLPRDLPLLVPHGVEDLDDLLLGLFILHYDEVMKILSGTGKSLVNKLRGKM